MSNVRNPSTVGQYGLAGVLLALVLRLKWWALLPLMLAWWLLKLLARGLRLLPYHPIVGASLTAFAAVAWLNPLWLPSSLVLAVAGLWMWRQSHPPSFRRHVAPRLRGWRRSMRRYRWGRPGWRKTMKSCRITGDGVPPPWLVSVHSTPHVDKLRVNVPTGHDETAFQDFRADLLHWGWRVQSVRVFNPEPKRHLLELWNLVDDPLIEPVKPFPKPTSALPKKGLALSLGEDGEPWHWRLGHGAAHMLAVGISGAGKGSVIGAIHDATTLGREQRIIRLLGIDLQASELGMSRHLYSKLVYTQADAADLLEAEVERMDKRTRKLFGISRQHHPTPGDEFDVVVIDEGLILLDKTNRVLYRRIDAALSALLRGSRKASIAVVFISQRAELDIIGPRRKDFHIAVALAQNPQSPDDVDMVLGRGALAAGANAHEITTPGVGFIATAKGIVRVRFPHITDDHLRALPPAPGNEDPENLPAPPGPPRFFVQHPDVLAAGASTPTATPDHGRDWSPGEPAKGVAIPDVRVSTADSRFL